MSEPVNRLNRPWTGGWNDPPPSGMSAAKDRNSVVTRQTRPGARYYPTNPMISGAGTAGQQQPSSPSYGAEQQPSFGVQHPTYGNHGNTQHPTYTAQQQPSYDAQQQGYTDQSSLSFGGYNAGSGGYPQDQYGSSQSNENTSPWSITEYLRAGIEKIDLDTISNGFNSLTEKIGSYTYSMPQSQHQSQDHLFSAQTNGQHYNQQSQYNQQYDAYTQQQQQQQAYAAYNAQPSYSQPQQPQHQQQQQQQQQAPQLTIGRHDDTYSQFCGPADPAPPPLLGHPAPDPVTSGVGSATSGVGSATSGVGSATTATPTSNYYQPVSLPEPVQPEPPAGYYQQYLPTQPSQQPQYQADFGAVPSIPIAEPTPVQQQAYQPWQPSEFMPQQQQQTPCLSQEMPVSQPQQEQLPVSQQQQSQMFLPQTYAPQEQPPIFAPQEQPPIFAPQEQPPIFAPQEQPPIFAPQEQPPMFAPQQQFVPHTQPQVAVAPPLPVTEQQAPLKQQETTPQQPLTELQSEQQPPEPVVALPDPQQAPAEHTPVLLNDVTPVVEEPQIPDLPNNDADFFNKMGGSLNPLQNVESKGSPEASPPVRSPPPEDKPQQPPSIPTTAALIPPPTSHFFSHSTPDPPSLAPPPCLAPVLASSGTTTPLPTQDPPKTPDPFDISPPMLPNSPPTLPVETFGGVNIFKPEITEEVKEKEVEVSDPSGWDNDFDDWNDIGSNDNRGFEDIQL